LSFIQGEVEQIALMKPKAVNEHGDGMLEYLEDIIGSSRFKGTAIDSLVRITCLQWFALFVRRIL